MTSGESLPDLISLRLVRALEYDGALFVRYARA